MLNKYFKTWKHKISTSKSEESRGTVPFLVHGYSACLPIYGFHHERDRRSTSVQVEDNRKPISVCHAIHLLTVSAFILSCSAKATNRKIIIKTNNFVVAIMWAYYKDYVSIDSCCKFAVHYSATCLVAILCLHDKLIAMRRYWSVVHICRWHVLLFEQHFT